jgi:hypothetical protein
MIKKIKNIPLFYRLPQTLIKIFSGKFLIAHGIAILLTILIVTGGLDWAYFVGTRTPLLSRIILPAVILGGLLPFLLPIALIIYGKITKRARIINSAWALGQAALLGSLISSTYKALTGRMPPPHFTDTIVPLIDTSHGFRFGFMEGGIFWGWPSSHTTIAVAMSVAFVTLFPEKKRLVALAL